MNKSIDSIQALRGLAAFLVVVVHAQILMQTYEQRYGLSAAWLNSAETLRLFGQCGVDIFFVISGFVMAYIVYDKYRQPSATRDFLRRRAVRIVPLYWVYTSIIGFLLLALPQFFHRATFDLRGLVFSYLFIPYTPSENNVAPVLAVGWTLTYEMYFYLLVAVGLFFPRKQFLIGLGCFFAVSVLMPLPFTGPVAYVVTNPLLLEFYAGFLIGTAYKRGLTLPAWLSCLCLVCGIVWLAAWGAGMFAATRVLEWGAPSALLVAGSVFLEKSVGIRFPKWTLNLGNASYSLYLSHFLLLPCIGKAGAMLGIWRHLPPDVCILLLSIGCCIGGYMAYRLLEIPLLHLFQYRKRTVSIPATG